VITVFVSEFVTSGAWADQPLEGSLAREGRAMIEALVLDLATDPTLEVATTWDSRLGRFPVPGVHAEVVDNTISASRQFQDLAGWADRTVVIAPEIGGMLTDSRQSVLDAGGCPVSCQTAALALCSDKLATACHLRGANVSTIDTRTEAEPRPRAEMVVWKPRDGAGSIGIAVQPADAPPPAPDLVVQPFLEGIPVSVSFIIDRDRYTSLPVARQHLVDEQALAYAGGTIPAAGCSNETYRQAVTVATAACRSIEGLYGWVGVDLILHEQLGPVVLEINPRLTTSFLGYRQLSGPGLARHIVFPDEPYDCDRLSDPDLTPITFTSAGNILATA